MAWNKIFSNPSSPHWRVGDVVRSRYGDWALWRIEETYGADSPYVFAVLVSTHKFHKAGMEKRLLPKKDYQLENSPESFARSHGFKLQLDVKLSPEAEWR